MGVKSAIVGWNIYTDISLNWLRVELYGFSMTEFVVASAVEAAKRMIQEQTVLKLSKSDREVFVNALLNPPEAGEKLRDSAKRYKQSQSYHI
ncbi:hypothetical protein BCD67_16705 [Oscillatoriales cyanobacterium USR001]|nr:hypothetical protein BCD67_16705 [Oscillatoriales cyanobacterium USR001]